MASNTIPDLTAEDAEIFIANLESNAAKLSVAMTGPVVSNITYFLLSRRLLDSSDQEPVERTLANQGAIAAAKNLIQDVLKKCKVPGQEIETVNAFRQALTENLMGGWESKLREAPKKQCQEAGSKQAVDDRAQQEKKETKGLPPNVNTLSSSAETQNVQEQVRAAWNRGHN